VPIGNRFSLEPFYEVDNTARSIEVLLLKSIAPSITVDNSDFAWLDFPSGTYYNDTTISVDISENTTGVERIGYVVLKYENELGISENFEIPIIQNA
jgi:hypothetical protein